MGKTKWVKGTKFIVVADASGLPPSVHTASASPHEITLVKLPSMKISPWDDLEELSEYRAYYADMFDESQKLKGIELIAPYRSGRIKMKTLDDRPLRRCGRRWKVERTIAWLLAFKCVLV